MKFASQLFIASALSFSLFGQEPAKVTSAKITEVGIYEAKVLTDQTNAAGVKLQGLDEFKLLKSTTNIPARIGVRYGFRYEILGSPKNAPIVLTMVGKHPPMKNSTTGRVGTVDTYQLTSWVGKTYTSDSLEEKAELVPGPRTLEVWHQGKKLCEQTFLIVAKEDQQISPPKLTN